MVGSHFLKINAKSTPKISGSRSNKIEYIQHSIFFFQYTCLKVAIRIRSSSSLTLSLQCFHVVLPMDCGTLPYWSLSKSVEALGAHLFVFYWAKSSEVFLFNTSGEYRNPLSLCDKNMWRRVEKGYCHDKIRLYCASSEKINVEV